MWIPSNVDLESSSQMHLLCSSAVYTNTPFTNKVKWKGQGEPDRNVTVTTMHIQIFTFGWQNRITTWSVLIASGTRRSENVLLTSFDSQTRSQQWPPLLKSDSRKLCCASDRFVHFSTVIQVHYYIASSTTIYITENLIACMICRYSNYKAES